MYPVKLEMDMPYQMINTFQNTIFQISVDVPLINYVNSKRKYDLNKVNKIKRQNKFFVNENLKSSFFKINYQ